MAGSKTSQTNDGDEGVLVNLAGVLFQLLKALTPLSILGATVFRGSSKRFRSGVVEVWIVLNLLLSVSAAISVALAADTPLMPAWVPPAVGLYAAYRLYDIVVVQVNVLLFDPYFHRKRYLSGKESEPYALRGRYRLVLALLANFLEIGFWYSAAYLYLQHLGQLTIAELDGGGILELPLVFQQCMRALVTFDVSAFVAAKGSLAFALVIIQSFVGMFMTIVMLARVVSLLPPPRAETD